MTTLQEQVDVANKELCGTGYQLQPTKTKIRVVNVEGEFLFYARSIQAARLKISKLLPDIYDREIERLTALYNPDDPYDFVNTIREAWLFHNSDNPDAIVGPYDPHSPLFDACDQERTNSEGCGCLTQVKQGYRSACNQKLTEAIKLDDRIPDGYTKITHPNQLQAFAEWQRRLDKEIPGRLPPVAPKL